MNLSDLKKIAAFTEPEKISEFTVEQCLVNLKYYGRRITDIFAKYNELDKNSDIAIIMLDAIKNNFNDYVQTFLDLTLIVCDDSVITSIGSATRAFISKFEPQEPELSFIGFMNERNSIIHEYYNREFLNERVIDILSNYVEGALGTVKIFEDYVRTNNLGSVKIKKGKR